MVINKQVKTLKDGSKRISITFNSDFDIKVIKKALEVLQPEDAREIANVTITKIRLIKELDSLITGGK